MLLAGARRPVTPVGLKFGGGRVKSTGGAGTGRMAGADRTAGAAATGRVAGATVVGSGGKLSLNELAAAGVDIDLGSEKLALWNVHLEAYDRPTRLKQVAHA